MSETNRIEYKRELNTDVDIEKEVIAFLNYHEGGIIYIGIDKLGKVLGVSDIDGDMLKIKDRIKNNIAPSAMGLFDVVAENKEGKELIKIIVASGTEKPYFKKKYGMTEKACFIRIGTASEPMPQTMIDKLFASRTRNSIGKIKSHRQELTFEQLKIYYEENGLTFTNRFKQNLELLTEDGKLNYVAYLLADENGTSIKVAKYSGTDRVDLIENNEYGYCSLIKATKRVIDKLELENKTFSKITSKERIDKRLWNAVALREAIINAIIHNDYTREIPPKFEIFSDRLEITNYGGLFEGMLQEDFFDGLSLPRNKELMRVYKDLGMVEQLGSGVPRILQAYSKDCFKFSENFIRMTFPASEINSPQVTMQVAMQVTMQVEELIKVFTGEHTRQELQDKLNLVNRDNFRKNYLQTAIDEDLIELTIPDKPNSSKQKYRLTEKGVLLKTKLS
ncbi:MAG: putative DNA binding domain-containing protein [Bacteroidales bacterium]|nr:putative DNA binding domain-containing protein [Bacteroidales bacterium]